MPISKSEIVQITKDTIRVLEDADRTREQERRAKFAKDYRELLEKVKEEIGKAARGGMYYTSIVITSLDDKHVVTPLIQNELSEFKTSTGYDDSGYIKLLYISWEV